MPKMRGFKAEIWTDEKFVDLTPYARLLFMGMWNYACDNGHLDDKPKQIKMRVLPTDAVDPAELIGEMVDLGMVERRDGLLVVTKLREHQRIDERYFMWCDRCVLEEIPERSRERFLSATQGSTSAPTSTRGDTRAPAMKEGRKEGEGEGSESEGNTASRKRPAKPLPDNWEPTPAHLERCRANNLDGPRELARFKAHAEANDRRQANWNAAFTQWLLSARPQPVNNRPPGEGPDDWMRRRP